MKYFFSILLCMTAIFSSAQHDPYSLYKAKYRPQFHFAPAIHWINDPNGLVYNNGLYHLFYQYNPFGIQWGHMSWGHATSKDLIHWKELPVALREEADTMIFSGSCVVDKNNSSGFAKEADQVPMVAVYTAFVKDADQSQHIAYSLDGGTTWIKYNHNPVLDLHKKDFRDPSVSWYAPGNKWIMAVAWPIEKQVHFYSSPDLKKWEALGSFGPAGDTTGIWECPDLFQAPIEGEPGKIKWVLMHSPAPYMQYFVGEFDGKSFVNENPASIIYRPDFGSDYYAAITYNNLPAGQPPVSIGWVNNWNYANDIPTKFNRGTMSWPRKLSVKKIDNQWILVQQPVSGFERLRGHLNTWKNITVNTSHTLPFRGNVFEMIVSFRPGDISGIRVVKGNDHYFEIGYDSKDEKLYIDRSKASDTTFNASFNKLNRFETKLPVRNGRISLHIFVDKSIIEVFANDGEAVMTSQFFTSERNNAIEFFNTGKPAVFETVTYWATRHVKPF